MSPSTTRSPTGASTRETVTIPGIARPTATIASRPTVGAVSVTDTGSVCSTIDGWSTAAMKTMYASAYGTSTSAWGMRTASISRSM
jgi:hypothetical protein